MLFKQRVVLALASACAVLSGLAPSVVRAELPPWVYGERQRQAPLVVRLAVERGVTQGGDVHVQGRVLQVIRQAKAGAIQAGQRIWLLYANPVPQRAAMVGPAAVPALRAGETVTAWLEPIQGTRTAFTPAAGGRSFGPSMEEAKEPGAP